MKILDRHKTWIHTHFLTDCVRLPAHRVREVESRATLFLRTLGIVYGIHLEEHRGEAGLRIVLECIPFPETIELIQAELQRIVDPIPAKPRPVGAIHFSAPRGSEEEAGVDDGGLRAGKPRTGSSATIHSR